MDVLLDSTTRGSSVVDAALVRSDENRALFPVLSREICRPLISLCAGFDLLLAGCEGPVSPEQRDQVQSLRGHCDDLIRFTRSYLDYAGEAREAREPDWASFRLGSLIEEADRQFAVIARGRQIAWSCRLEGDDVPVTTDLACFQQVLGRLVTNALAHTPDGGRIDISARIEGESWLVAVADDGRGIPPEVLDRVFEPLVRMPCASRGQGIGRGHGMGLAVCRDLIERLGGEIQLRSEPGRGTSALVRFPRTQPQG
jgi:two-component system phosphate regulon sensor histidine kinase PhoR